VDRRRNDIAKPEVSANLFPAGCFVVTPFVSLRSRLCVFALSTPGEMDRYRGNSGDRRENRGHHDDDVPGGALFGSRRRPGDAHGVNEKIRDELHKVHGYWIVP
jgi:hypothetical protein